MELVCKMAKKVKVLQVVDNELKSNQQTYPKLNDQWFTKYYFLM